MSHKPRILGLDIGEKRIGIAISDLFGTTAAGLELIVRKSTQADLEAVKQIAERHGAVEIIVGLPQNPDGSPDKHLEEVRNFGRSLARVTGLPIIYEDERLTTISTIRTLTIQGVRTEGDTTVIELQQAAIMLQKFLDHSEPPSSA